MTITRIAPSPTGFLHLGTARTALFNYLFAKKKGGKMYLRIEDTDKERSKKVFEDDIIAGLKFLGIKWDGVVVRQTDRLSIYKKYIDELGKNGFTYELDGAIWLKVSAVKTKDKIEFIDTIRGKICFSKAKIKDFVIVTSKKMPLFLLTNVIDDYEMKITDVIRGEDHISNTPRQILIQMALKLPALRYAHIPLILAPDKSKMSKRAGAVSLLEYRKQGFLAESMVNMLGLLGFHPREEKEILDLSELITEFDLKRVQRAGAIFNQDKLLSINAWYIRNMGQSELAERISSFDGKIKVHKKYLTILKDRFKTLADYQAESKFLHTLPDYSAELLVFKKSTLKDSLNGLKLIKENLAEKDASFWADEKNIREALQEIVDNNDLSNGDVFWSSRVALSGLANSPQPSEIAWALGKEESLTRIKKAIGKL